MREYSINNQNENNSKRIESVQNLIIKYEQLSGVYKVRTDSAFKERKYLSLNTMNEDDNNMIPALNQSVVNKFLQTQNNVSNFNGSERELPRKNKQRKRSKSFKEETKNSEKTQKNKKSSDSVFSRYFRSFSDSKNDKQKSVTSKEKYATWYSNDASNNVKVTSVKQDHAQQTRKFENPPDKKVKEPTTSEQNNDVQNIQFLRKKSYILAMQTDCSIGVNNDELPKRKCENSYVSKTVSKFEEQSFNDIKRESKSTVEELFKNYHRKVKITGDTSREKLSLEINNALLEKCKQLKSTTTTDAQLFLSNSKTEPLASSEDEEVECITLVYNKDDDKLTKYSKQEYNDMETEYTIYSTQLNGKTNEEIVVFNNGQSWDLNRTYENGSDNVASELEKIQEKLNDVIKNIDTEIEIEKSSSQANLVALETKASKIITEQVEEIFDNKENIFEFWKRRNSISALENTNSISEENQNKSIIQLNKTLNHENIKNPDMSCDIEEKLEKDKFEIQNIQQNVVQKSEIKIDQKETPDITYQGRPTNLFSNISTNPDMSDSKPCSNVQINEENKKKIEARNSFFSSMRLSFRSNYEDEAEIKADRRSFSNSIADERMNTSLKKYHQRDQNDNQATEISTTCNLRKSDAKQQNKKPESTVLVEIEKKPNHLEPNRNSFLNSRRSSLRSNISEIKTEDISRKSVLHSKSLSLTKDNEEFNKLLRSKDTSVASVSSNNFRTSESHQSRLYSGSFRKSYTNNNGNEDLNVEDNNKVLLVRQETPRLSRLYKGKLRYNSKKIDKKDNNNNTCDVTTKEQQSTDIILQFESDNDEETVETYNPYFNDVSKHEYTKEWVHNTIEVLAQKRVSESESIDEDQFSNQLRKTVDVIGLKTCTLFNEQNNPAIRLSCYDDLLDIFDKECQELDEVQKDIEQAEKQYHESIEDIQNNSQIACLIAELKSTEQNYVKLSLRRLVEDYMPEMNRTDLPPNLVGKVRTIFGNADILYENHKSKFLPDLEASKTIEDIAECFLKYEEKIFKYYPLYTKNKPKSELIMRDYSDFFKHKQELLHDRLDLSSYLLTPVQRMAKYCQIVNGLVKKCDKEGKPSSKLKKASEMLIKLMSKGNDLIALDSIIKFDGDIRQEGDLLLRDTFFVQPPHRKHSYEGMLFLFEESILITQITRNNGSEYFDYQDSIKVCDMGYTDNPAEPLEFNIWYRKRDQKNYVIRANKKEKQQKWVKEIFDLLWKQLEANKMRKKKEYEESGLNETKIPLVRPTSEHNIKNNTFKSSKTNMALKKKTTSETIWYSAFQKKFDFSDS